MLVESSAEGDGVAIQGSVEAVKRLEDEGEAVKLSTLQSSLEKLISHKIIIFF